MSSQATNPYLIYLLKTTYLPPMRNFTRLDYNRVMTKNLLLIASVLLLFSSCDKKFNTVGATLLPKDQFPSSKATYPITVQHLPTEVVQTSNLIRSTSNNSFS